jgi:hypothetical protein
MGRVTAHVAVAGSYTSAVTGSELGLLGTVSRPPAISTLPSASGVAVAPGWVSLMLPVGDHVSVVGSYRGE